MVEARHTYGRRRAFTQGGISSSQIVDRRRHRARRCGGLLSLTNPQHQILCKLRFATVYECGVQLRTTVERTGRTPMSIAASATTSDRREINRRSFLYATTTAVGTAGAAMATWPLIDQMNPDARVRAAGDVIEVDLTKLRPAEQRVVRWQNLPISVVRRTPTMLQAMQGKTFVTRLIDADSQARQQPSYAKNWYRSINPDYAVLVGVCTHIRCILTYYEKTSLPFSMAGGYVCPCCAAHYDPAGRAHAGTPAQYNLAVPPYSFTGPSKILLGKNASDEFFSLQSVERI
jgi:ubiquinol-cytochrome c reductase iron-sulfur subunit